MTRTDNFSYDVVIILLFIIVLASAWCVIGELGQIAKIINSRIFQQDIFEQAVTKNSVAISFNCANISSSITVLKFFNINWLLL
jgi:hypothetical protein